LFSSLAFLFVVENTVRQVAEWFRTFTAIKSDEDTEAQDIPNGRVIGFGANGFYRFGLLPI
jgi:hypothetical protein